MDQMLKYLIAFILGYLVSRQMGNGFRVGLDYQEVYQDSDNVGLVMKDNDEVLYNYTVVDRCASYTEAKCAEMDYDACWSNTGQLGTSGEAACKWRGSEEDEEDGDCQLNGIPLYCVGIGYKLENLPPLSDKPESLA